MKTELYMQVDLKHMHQEPGNNVVTMGIDLTEFYLSVEWEIFPFFYPRAE